MVHLLASVRQIQNSTQSWRLKERRFVAHYPCQFELKRLITLAVSVPLANLLRTQSGLHQDKYLDHPEASRQGETFHLHPLGSYRDRELAQRRWHHHPVGKV